MDDQERVEDLPKDFNPAEKRPSQSSEDVSWTFLEERKSAENSPKPPKITVNSNLLCLPDYDAEPEMSDGISVISEGEGHHTPPESDTTAATPEATDNNNGSDPGNNTSSVPPRFSFDTARMTRSSGGYRPLTPPQTPPTEEDYDEDDDEKKDLATIRSVVQQKKEKLDVESYEPSESRRFIGIYPRHVVFLMVICGIIGGMIGHLWNLNYGCNCEDQMAAALENCALRQTFEKDFKFEQSGPQESNNNYKQKQNRFVPKWSGHEENDDSVAVEDDEVTTTDRPFIPSDQFESMIWEHLKETGASKPVYTQDENINSEFKEATESEKDHLDRDSFDNKNNKQNSGRYKRSKEVGVSDDSNEGDDNIKKQSWKKPNKYEGKYPGSGEKYHQKYESSKEAKKLNNKQKPFEKNKNGRSGEVKKFNRDDSDEDESGEENRKSRNYNDRKYQSQNNKRDDRKGKERSSGEWNDKRNRGRDELRQQKQAEEKNWYLERGNEREINRVETVAAAPDMTS